jgi:hypothetical protein
MRPIRNTPHNLHIAPFGLQAGIRSLLQHRLRLRSTNAGASAACMRAIGGGGGGLSVNGC